MVPPDPTSVNWGRRAESTHIMRILRGYGVSAHLGSEAESCPHTRSKLFGGADLAGLDSEHERGREETVAEVTPNRC